MIQYVGKGTFHLDANALGHIEPLGQACVQVDRSRTRHVSDARGAETSDRIRVPGVSNEARRTDLPAWGAGASERSGVEPARRRRIAQTGIADQIRRLIASDNTRAGARRIAAAKIRCQERAAFPQENGAELPAADDPVHESIHVAPELPPAPDG